MCAPAPAATKGRGYRPRRRRKADPFVGPDRKQWAECRRCLLLRVSINAVDGGPRRKSTPCGAEETKGSWCQSRLAIEKAKFEFLSLGQRDGRTHSRRATSEFGKEAEVYICGPFALKLYKSSARKGSPFREAAILATIESLGLRTPIVHRVQKVDDRWGVLMSRVEGPSFAEEMAVQSGPVSIWLDRMAFLHSAVHQHFAPTFPSVKSRLAANISVARQLRDVHRKALLAELAEMPEGDRLCHGDFHPHNIMGPIGRETIIDWLDAAKGEPAADVCRSYVLIRSKHPERASYTKSLKG